MPKVSTGSGGGAGARGRPRRGWFAGLAGGVLVVTAPAVRAGAGGAPPGRGAAAGGAAAVYRAETSVVLPPQVNPFGQPEVDVRAFVLVRGGEAVLVDTLTPGNAGLIGAALAAAGLGWDALRHVLLTHAHPDHAGSAADVLALAPGATAWIAAAEAHLVALPRPARALDDGDEVAGLRIVATPGHSPGHVCVLDAAGSTAMLGDAAHNVGGPPGLIGPPLTPDPARAAASLARLAALGFQRALFAHGPALESGAAVTLAAVGSGAR